MSTDEFRAAHESIDRGDYAQARHHINNLQMDGRDPADISELLRRLTKAENSHLQTTLKLQGYAIACSVLGYAILSIQSPAKWSPVVWGITAFLAIPLMVGIFSGNSVSEPKGTKRFWRAFFIASIPMAIYTLVGMYLSRSKMQSADTSMDVVIFATIMIVYGAVAGLVAGFTSSVFGTKPRLN